MVVVERDGGSIDRVDDDKLAAGDTGGFDDHAERSHKELGSEPLTMKVLAQGKSGEQDQRDLSRGSNDLRGVGADRRLRPAGLVDRTVG